MIAGFFVYKTDIDRTDEGIEAVKNEEMLGTVYNDKEGQAREMLNLAFVIATDGDKSDIPLIDGKYVRTPYHKLTLENIELKWTFRDSNPGPTGYEPVALTN